MEKEPSLTQQALDRKSEISSSKLLSLPFRLTVIPGASGYQAGKTAINRFTEFVYEEYKDEGIRVFAYHPGGVMTTLASGLPEKFHHFLQDTAELSAGFCLYLSSSKADYLNGRYVSANWDVDELEQITEEILTNDRFKMILS